MPTLARATRPRSVFSRSRMLMQCCQRDGRHCRFALRTVSFSKRKLVRRTTRGQSKRGDAPQQRTRRCP